MFLGKFVKFKLNHQRADHERPTYCGTVMVPTCTKLYALSAARLSQLLLICNPQEARSKQQIAWAAVWLSGM